MNKQTTLVFMGLFTIALLFVVLLQLEMLPGFSSNDDGSQESVPILDRAENASSVTDTFNPQPVETLPNLDATADVTPEAGPETPPESPAVPVTSAPVPGEVVENALEPGSQPAAPEATPPDAAPSPMTAPDANPETQEVAQMTPPSVPEAPDQPVRPSPNSANSAPNQVSRVQLTPTDQGADIVITSLGAFERYKYFTLKEPGRLVVDLYGNYEEPDSLDTLATNSVVSGLRSGMHEGKFRLVFDLASEADYEVEVVKLSDAEIEVRVSGP